MTNHILDSAGERLRADLDAALARESEKVGRPLRWDEREVSHIAAACRAADHVGLLQARLDAEVCGGEDRASIVVKLVAEIRNQDRSIGEHLAWLQLDEFAPPAKSPQHRAAALSRWGAQRPPKRVS